MSNTITLTTNCYAQINTVLQLNSELDVQILLKRMHNECNLPSKHRQYIHQWEQKNLSFFSLIETFVDKEKATQALFDLLIQCLRPAFAESNATQQSILLEVEMEFKLILARFSKKNLDEIENEIERVEEENLLKEISLVQEVVFSQFPLGQGGFEQQIGSFIERLHDSKLFSPQDQELLHRWQKESQSYFQPSTMQTKEGKTQASQVLCFLLVDIIRPAYRREENESRQLELVKFELSLKKILEDLLQRESQYINQYVQSIQSLCDEQNLVEKALQFIEEQEQKWIKELYQSSMALDAQLRTSMEALKGRLIALITQEQKDLQILVDRLDVLMQSMETLMNRLKNQTPQLEGLGQRITNDNQVFNKFCHDALHLLEQV